MIETVIDLRRDGNEQPQFFALTVKYANMGEGYSRTIICGTQGYLRAVLKAGGISEQAIKQLFANAH